MIKKILYKLFFTLHILVHLFVIGWQRTRTLRSFFSNCRFYPSCSDYFLQSVKHCGLMSGLLLFIKRILKCHPLQIGGVDEVPSAMSKTWTLV